MAGIQIQCLKLFILTKYKVYGMVVLGKKNDEEAGLRRPHVIILSYRIEGIPPPYYFAEAE